MIKPNHFPKADHNHQTCISAALTDADSYCKARGYRLTELRRRVLELVWSSHKPIGAYAILEELGNDGRKPAPPTVYRSLEFLQEHGLIHRIASLNAFMGCCHPGQHHAAQFFICNQCGNALELACQGIKKAINGDAKQIGFQVLAQTIEINGICQRCQTKPVEK